MFVKMDYDYIVRLISDEILVIQMTGTFDDAYETAKNHHIYADSIVIEDNMGKKIISLTRDQLMDEGLKITYIP
jgi:hypothetical protein